MDFDEMVLKNSKEMDADLWFDLVFDETRDAVLRYIYIHISDPASADDVFQDVHTSLYQRVLRKGTRDIRKPEAFLIRMTKRELARHHRRVNSRQAVPAEETTDIACPGFEDSVAVRDELRIVQETVRALPPLTYKVFVLYYFFDMTVSAIADELGSTTYAVKSRLNRARKAVRERLEVTAE